MRQEASGAIRDEAGRLANAESGRLPVDHPRATEVREIVDLLVGPGRRIDDVWVWDVREFVARG